MKNLFYLLCGLLAVPFLSIKAQTPESEPMTEGRDFWVTFMQADQDPNNALILSLSIVSRENCQVMISNPYAGYVQTVNVSANQLQQVELYNGNVLLDNARNAMQTTSAVCYAGYSEVVDTCALRVQATADISLFAINYKRATCDATNVLPTNALRDTYVIQTYTPSDHGGVSASQGSHFAVIAVEDNTVIDYCPTVETKRISEAKAAYEFTGGAGMSEEELALANWQVGDTLHSPMLRAGQVYYVWTGKKDGETGDLSGTYVKARDNKRIAVFQGCPHTNIPYQVKQRDQILSQAMPSLCWGEMFVLTASMDRPCDIVRLMALEDNTEVYINGQLVHTFNFANEPKHFWEFEIGPSGQYAQSGSCVLTTSHPCAAHLFLVSQRYNGNNTSSGDPSMLWLNPVEQQTSQASFVTYSSTNGTTSNYVNIVTDRPDRITMDGLSISSQFTPADGSNTYYYARISLGSTAAAHTLYSSEGTFSAHVYGFTQNESYGFSAGGAARVVSGDTPENPDPEEPLIVNGCINYIDLNSATCYIDNSSPTNTLTFNDFVQVEAVDYGPASISSRHTIHTDVNETEARTGGMAKTIPEGEIASVRLGNWDVNNQAERIEYSLVVDTTQFKELILKYLPLLEAPGHDDGDNPRVKFDVLINGQSLGSFAQLDISGNNVYSMGHLVDGAEEQGWHLTPASTAGTSADIIWKEWSTFRVNLCSPMYQGRTITIRLTSHDCTYSAHSGYVYFTLGCTPAGESEEPEPQPTESTYNIIYWDQAGLLLDAEVVTLHLPEAPVIEGFTFLKWQVVAGDLEEGIYIQAVYTANEPTNAPAAYINPANPAQKLIRNGQVYILNDAKIYSITGQKVR